MELAPKNSYDVTVATSSVDEWVDAVTTDHWKYSRNFPSGIPASNEEDRLCNMPCMAHR